MGAFKVHMGAFHKVHMERSHMHLERSHMLDTGIDTDTGIAFERSHMLDTLRAPLGTLRA